MKKRIVSFLLAGCMLSTLLTGCSSADTSDKNQTSTDDKSGKYEIALITDVATIDDKSFNQGSWEGVIAYAEETGVSHKYYMPNEKSDEAILNAIHLAVKNGAKFIICPGYLFEVAVYQAQRQYPDVTFMILDGEPNDGNNTTFIAKNTTAVYFAEEQAGFLAGYAAVKDGYRSLGFMGGIAVPAVVRYGYGFVQGADYAAKELGMDSEEITMKYTYVGNFDATPENMTLAASWYNEGVEVIFGCGGGVGNSVMKAAQTAGKKVIGVDVDQYSESDTVITSAMKNLQKAVKDTLTSFYDGSFVGGKAITLDATTESVRLPMEHSLFTQFGEEEYKAVYGKLVSKEIVVGKNEIAQKADEIAADHVKVMLVE